MLHHAATHTFQGDTEGFGRWLERGLGLVCLVKDGAWIVAAQRTDVPPSDVEIDVVRRAFHVPADAEVLWPKPNVCRLTWPCVADLALGPDGLIAQALPGYEYRAPQLYMARLVELAARGEAKLVVEAGTGTGKSLAYLAPLILLGKRVTVCTANKALQAQLWQKDVPFLQKHLRPFTAALAKGRQNYVCRKKVEADWGGGILMPTAEMAPWYATTQTGDLEEMDTVVTGEELAAVTVDDEGCLGRRCSFYDICWYYAAKKARGEAQVVITNHALLCLHQQHPEGNILPITDTLVVDEAHQLEGYAVNVQSVELTPFALRDAAELVGEGLQASGVENEAGAIPFTAQATAFFRDLAERLRENETQAGIRHDVAYERAAQLAKTLSDAAEKLWRGDNTPENEEEQRQANKAKRLRNLAAKFLVLAGPTPDGAVRHIEQAQTRKGEKYLKALYTTFDVSAFLQRLADAYPAAIYASATLAVASAKADADFTFFQRRNGVGEALTYQADSPFDYRQNAQLYVPNGTMPDSKDEGYIDAVIEEIRALVEAAQGGAFLLFTSYNAMNRAYQALAPTWPYLTLRQGEQSKTAIMRRFAEDGNAVLFATKSFWEGVDVKGTALRLVVIDKIPFAQPSPVQNARCDLIEKQGGSWFYDLSLPEAIIDLKQGFGRLIRTQTDTGVVALLDPRIRRKPYGKQIVAALPPASMVKEIGEVARFFQDDVLAALLPQGSRKPVLAVNLLMPVKEQG
jgi:ATP-dependent DNA helicase DinG